MIVVITGASGGIGFGIAKALVNRGHIVYSFSRTKPQDERIRHIAVDISNRESVNAAFTEFFQRETHIDILVNNAGIGISGASEFTTEQDMKKIFDVNFFGSVYCSQCVIPKMRASAGGKRRAPKIVFISSVGSTFTLPFQTFYSATKTAINSFAEGLLMELKPFGIKVGTILPGDIRSNFSANREKDSRGEQEYGKRIENSLAKMEKDEGRGQTADDAGKKIAKYISKKKLKPHKVLGLQYKMLCVLDKILSRKIIIKILYKMYGK